MSKSPWSNPQSLVSLPFSREVQPLQKGENIHGALSSQHSALSACCVVLLILTGRSCPRGCHSFTFSLIFPSTKERPSRINSILLGCLPLSLGKKIFPRRILVESCYNLLTRTGSHSHS